MGNPDGDGFLRRDPAPTVKAPDALEIGDGSLVNQHVDVVNINVNTASDDDGASPSGVLVR